MRTVRIVALGLLAVMSAATAIHRSVKGDEPAAAPSDDALSAPRPDLSQSSDPRTVSVPQMTTLRPRPVIAGPEILELPGSIKVEGEWKHKYYCVGDFNKDDAVDDGDVALFIAVYQAREGPMVPWLDINHDGAVDQQDVEAFLQAYESRDCDVKQMRELRQMVC